MRETKLYEKAWLDRFCALIPGLGSVLDCGCGVGTPIARYLSEHGYAVTGIDTSVAMIRMFQERLPKERALVADMRTLCRRHRISIPIQNPRHHAWLVLEQQLENICMKNGSLTASQWALRRFARSTLSCASSSGFMPLASVAI